MDIAHPEYVQELNRKTAVGSRKVDAGQPAAQQLPWDYQPKAYVIESGASINLPIITCHQLLGVTCHW